MSGFFDDHDSIAIPTAQAKQADADAFFDDHDSAPIPQAKSEGSKAMEALGGAAHSTFDTASDLAHSASTHLPLADLGAKLAAHGYASTQMLHSMFRDGGDQHTYDDYLKEGLAKEMASRAEGEKRSPTAWKAGAVLGPIESLAAPLPGAGMAGLAGVGTRIAGNAALGALDNGSRGLANPELMNAEQAKQGATVGGGTAAAMEAALPILGKVAGPVAGAAKTAFGAGADKLGELAEGRAFKAAVGNQQKFTDEAVKQGRVNEIGRDLLDNGVVGFGDRARDIADKARLARGDAGNEISEVLEQADRATPAAASPLSAGWRRPGLVDGRSIASQLRAYADRIGGEGNAATVAKIQAIADSYEHRGPMSLVDAQVEKNSFKYRPGDPGNTFDKEANNTIKGIIGDEMEVGVRNSQAVAQPAAQFAEGANTGSGVPSAGVITREGGPMIQEADAVPQSAIDAYQGAKQRYGSFSTAGQAADKLAAREAKNATFGLLPTITGAAATGAAIAHGNPLMALAAPVVAVGHKLAQTRGNASLAVGADRLSETLRATPERFGKFANVLLESAKRGNQSLAVTHYMLSQQDPEYSKMMGTKP